MLFYFLENLHLAKIWNYEAEHTFYKSSETLSEMEQMFVCNQSSAGKVFLWRNRIACL